MIPGATTSTIQATTNGYYTVIATLLSGCSISSPSYPYGISATASLVSEIIYADIVPNPSHGNFNIRIHSGSIMEGNIIITDLAGRIIYKEEKIFAIGSTDFPVNLSAFEKGVYLVRIGTVTGNINRRIVVD